MNNIVFQKSDKTTTAYSRLIKDTTVMDQLIALFVLSGYLELRPKKKKSYFFYI